MAKKKQSLDIDVKGLSTEQILRMDVNAINKMNNRTIKALASRLVSSMNKRIRSLSKKAPNSQALNSLPKGFQFSTKGLGRNDVRSLVGDMIQFGNMKTSTVSGWKEYRKDVESKLGSGRSFSELRDEGAFWDVFRRLQESNHAIFQKISSDEILKMTFEEAVDNPEDLLERMQNSLDDIYNALEGKGMEDDIWGDSDDEDYF